MKRMAMQSMMQGFCVEIQELVALPVELPRGREWHEVEVVATAL